MSNIGHDTTVYTALNKWHDIATACISRRPVTTNCNRASNKKIIINLGFLAPEAPLLNFPQIQGTINWTQNHSYVI